MADSPAVGPRGSPDAARPLNDRLVCWEGQTVAVSYPDGLAPAVNFATEGLDLASGAPRHRLAVSPAGSDHPGCFDLSVGDATLLRGCTAGQAARGIVDELVRCLITDVSSGVVIHAGCVSRSGHAILLAGASGAGKSSLTAWLSSRGFDYHSDEATLLLPDAPTVTAMPRPLVIKDADAPWIADCRVRCWTSPI